MSTDMVGLFSAFEIFTRNAAAAYDITYSMLEQLDAAREIGKINGIQVKDVSGSCKEKNK